MKTFDHTYAAALVQDAHPMFSGVFSDFLAICSPRYIAQCSCVFQQEVVDSDSVWAEHAPFIDRG